MSVAYLVTCYNKSQYIAGVLDAIIAERCSTGGDIIVMDDGSDDSSLDIIVSRFRNQQNFLILQRENAGVVSATNSLFSQCNQPVFRLIDADDIILPGSTNALLSCLDRSGFDIIFGAHQVYESRPPSLEFVHRNIAYREILNPIMDAMRGNLFSVSSTLFRTVPAKALFPLSDHYRTSQDYMLSLRAALRALRIGRVQEIVSIGPKVAPNRLSADKRLVFGETAEFIASELGTANSSISRHAYTYALRRQSGRALLWNRRHGDRSLTKSTRLLTTRLFADMFTREQICRNMVWIARYVYGISR